MMIMTVTFQILGPVFVSGSFNSSTYSQVIVFCFLFLIAVLITTGLAVF